VREWKRTGVVLCPLLLHCFHVGHCELSVAVVVLPHVGGDGEERRGEGEGAVFILSMPGR
jgi:hypothetical protein